MKTLAIGNKSLALGILFITLLFGIPISSKASDVDFQARCQTPGVIKCVGFDTNAILAGDWGDVSGSMGNELKPEIDTTIKASGSGSMKFIIPSNSGSGTSGSWFTNFSDNLSTLFGQGEEFYIQWRQRFSPEMLRAFKSSSSPSGWKQAIIGEGDRAGVCDPNHPTSATCPTSCSELELVHQQDQRYLGPWFYHSCSNWDPLEFWDGTQIRLQHQGPPYCYYPNDPQGGCYRYVANEWMTFQTHVKIGTWNTNSSRIRVWAARAGQPSVMIYDSNISHPSGFLLHNSDPAVKYGKVWLLPYHTGKDASETHPTAYTWYDELIISRTKIQDPGPSGDIQSPAAPKNLNVK